MTLLDWYRAIDVDVGAIQSPARSHHPFGLLLFVLSGHVLEVFDLALGGTRVSGLHGLEILEEGNAYLGQGAAWIADQIAFSLLVGERSYGDVRTEMVLYMLLGIAWSALLQLSLRDRVWERHQRRNNCTALGLCLIVQDRIASR